MTRRASSWAETQLFCCIYGICFLLLPHPGGNLVGVLPSIFNRFLAPK